MKKKTARNESEPKLKLKKETLRNQEVNDKNLKTVIGGFEGELEPEQSLDCIK